MSIVNIIGFIIFCLITKILVHLSAAIQALERPNKTYHKIFKTTQRNLMENRFQCSIIKIERNSVRFSNNQP